MKLIMPEMKRRLHVDGYYYSNYDDIIEYSNGLKKYQIAKEIEDKEKLRKKIENDPEGEKWYNVEYGTEILVSHDNVNWKIEKFSERDYYKGEYSVRIYWDVLEVKFYSSHEGGVPNTMEYKYAKFITD